MNKMWRLLWLALFIPLYLASTCSEEDDEEQIAAEVTPPPGGLRRKHGARVDGRRVVGGRRRNGAAATFAEGEAAQSIWASGRRLQHGRRDDRLSGR
jgi:hypothetical protein